MVTMVTMVPRLVTMVPGRIIVSGQVHGKEEADKAKEEHADTLPH